MQHALGAPPRARKFPERGPATPFQREMRRGLVLRLGWHAAPQESRLDRVRSKAREEEARGSGR